MKASEFIKKCGWDCAIHAGSEDSPLYINLDYKDLEKYVSAYELVESYGGLGKANKLIDGSYIDSNHDIPRGHEELSMAIQLVEECL